MTALRFLSPSGDFYFDGRGAIISRFDVEYPEITRPALSKNAMSGVEYLSPQVGEGIITVEGYFIPGRLSVREYRRSLSQIASVGGEFTLWADGLTRRVFTKSLKFDSSPGFASGEADHFVLKLSSPDAYFTGEEESFYGVPQADGALYFPTYLGENFYVGEVKNTGEVCIVNRGDVKMGFTLSFKYYNSAQGIMLRSDREDGVFLIMKDIYGTEEIIVDTRYGRKSVTNSAGTDLLGKLDKECVFFQAYPGETRLTWVSLGGDSPSVKVTLVPGYLNV